jgi:protein-disulfide isomerase-like protein with CxxC motif
MTTVKVYYYSDILCIWAYAAQQAVNRLVGKSMEPRFCSVFPDAWGKIQEKWASKGGFEGFNRHINEVATRFPEVEVNDRLWLDCKPRTSASAHLYVKAVQLVEAGDDGDAPYLERPSARAEWALRRAFFASGRDVSDWHVHREISDEIGIDHAEVDARIRSSEAVAQLAVDYSMSQRMGVEGSPTFLMNEGRQKLFGNVGYHLLEANVEELLRAPMRENASD